MSLPVVIYTSVTEECALNTTELGYFRSLAGGESQHTDWGNAPYTDFWYLSRCEGPPTAMSDPSNASDREEVVLALYGQHL